MHSFFVETEFAALSEGERADGAIVGLESGMRVFVFL